MSRIEFLDKALGKYQKWLKRFNFFLAGIEETILQKDRADMVQEKLISIGISTIFMTIASNILLVVGITIFTGFIGGVLLFAIGWVLSLRLNKKIFGTVRCEKDLTNEEKTLLLATEVMKKRFKKMELRTRLRKERVYFGHYADIKTEFYLFLYKLRSHDESNLALKYRQRYRGAIKDYVVKVHQFDELYASKAI